MPDRDSTEDDDVFAILGDRGPPLRAEIDETVSRLQAEGYSLTAVVAALMQVSVNLAASYGDPAMMREFARALDSSLAPQLRALAQAKDDELPANSLRSRLVARIVEGFARIR